MVSIIAGTLQRAGLITYRRGVLRVLDREGLEDGSCKCYEVLSCHTLNGLGNLRPSDESSVIMTSLALGAGKRCPGRH